MMHTRNFWKRKLHSQKLNTGNFLFADDNSVVYAEIKYGDESVDVSLDASLSTSPQPIAGHSQWGSGTKRSKCGKRKINLSENKSGSQKEKRLVELPLIPIKDNDNLVDEWLQSEISKNKKIERLVELKIMKFELELGILHETSVST